MHVFVLILNTISFVDGITEGTVGIIQIRFTIKCIWMLRVYSNLEYNNEVHLFAFTYISTIITIYNPHITIIHRAHIIINILLVLFDKLSYTSSIPFRITTSYANYHLTSHEIQKLGYAILDFSVLSSARPLWF